MFTVELSLSPRSNIRQNTLQVDELIMVFDLGGGTLDVSIVEVGRGMVEVVATSGDAFLGGDDFDEAIATHLATKAVANGGECFCF